jgi:TDG/mug DNA glycosylase family protein
VTAAGLRVLFCGINPGMRSGELGQHFARPGNRFWRVLHESGFTPRVLAPSEQEELLSLGLGITNLVTRVSASAAELTAAELRSGALQLEERVAALAPAVVAVLGVQAYRTAFRRPRAAIGAQPERLARSGLWVLPNPSGLQARYQVPEMVALYRELRLTAG